MPQHRLTDINTETRTANCLVCGANIKIIKKDSKSWRCKIGYQGPSGSERRKKLNKKKRKAYKGTAGSGKRKVHNKNLRGEPGSAERKEFNRKRSLKRYPHRKYLKECCEICGFTGHPCQLDVDHIDQNHSNNDPANLQTLCANCHRLKTYNERYI